MRILNYLNTQSYSVRSLSYLFVSSHLIFFLMMTSVFPKINNQIGSAAFDLRTFGYSVSEARSILTHLNDQTTHFYLFPQLTLLDLFYPFLLALFLSSFLFRLFKLLKRKDKLNSILLILPFIAMIFDYLENACIILMITKSIEISEGLIQLSSTFTILKGLFTSLAWISILYYSIIWLRMIILKKKNKQSLTKANFTKTQFS